MLRNKYEMRGEKTAIFVEREKDGKTYEVMIDTVDLPRVLECRSVYILDIGVDRHGNPRSYARVHDAQGRKRYLHRYLTNAPDTLVVDHLDGNPLNNTRENLKVTTQAENMQNRKAQGKVGIRGVTYCDGYYIARVVLRGKEYYLGRYKTKEEAGEAAARFRERYMPNSPEGRNAACASPTKTFIAS